MISCLLLKPRSGTIVLTYSYENQQRHWLFVYTMKKTKKDILEMSSNGLPFRVKRKRHENGDDHENSESVMHKNGSPNSRVLEDVTNIPLKRVCHRALEEDSLYEFSQGIEFCKIIT